MMQHMQSPNQRTPSSHRSRNYHERKMTSSATHQSQHCKQTELPGRINKINTDHYQRRKRSHDHRRTHHHRVTNCRR